jgi:uncharacterized membrane protein
MTTRAEAHHAKLEAELKSAYDVDSDQRSKQLSLGMRIASFLGALSLAASAFFFFYKFWGRLDTAAQVVILVVAPLATFTFTIWLGTRDSTGYFTKLAAMVSFACFVIDLSMLGQIFNITPSDKAFFGWAAGLRFRRERQAEPFEALVEYGRSFEPWLRLVK